MPLDSKGEEAESRRLYFDVNMLSTLPADVGRNLAMETALFIRQEADKVRNSKGVDSVT